MSENRFNFGFGDSYAVREALAKYVPVDITDIEWDLGYADKSGDLEIEGYVRQMVLQATGRQYKHIVMTSGAHLGVAAALLTMSARLNSSEVYYDELHFLRYPQLVRTLNLLSASRADYYNSSREIIRLTASPSNPRGIVHSHGDEKNTIWDACYHNPIYTSPVSSELLPRPDHAIMVGSLGKITGINGLRLGWAATDDDALMTQLRVNHYNLTLGVSTTNIEIAKHFFRGTNFDAFTMTAWNYLCDNRTQLSKLEFLSADKVPSYGMFWFAEIDKQARDLLQKVGVTVIEGLECGGNENQVRISLGQTRALTQEMVKAVLKADGR